MLSNILLIVLVGLVVISYLVLLINWIVNMKKRIEDYNGFDVCREITNDCDDINIVKSNNVVFSEYDIKRNVIRLNSKNYDGNGYNEIVKSSILAGYSLVRVDNKGYFKFSFIFSKIWVISFSSLSMVLLSFLVNNIGDARIGVVISTIILFYLYMRYFIINEATSLIERNLSSDVYTKIKSIVIGYVNFYKLSFISCLVVLLRFIVIMFGI